MMKEFLKKEKLIRVEIENAIGKSLKKYQESTGLDIADLVMREIDITSLNDPQAKYSYAIKLTPKFPN